MEYSKLEHAQTPAKVPLSLAVQRAPETPGAYRFWDEADKVIYVGKAKNLKNRIKNHLSGTDTDTRHSAMIKRARTMDWIIVPDETEALVLEDTLIKKHHPDYNVRFRDDKRYPLIRLSIKDDYPALSVVRKSQPDGARYYGPYVASRSMRSLLKIIGRHFPLRRCQNPLSRKSGTPCLNFQMHRCAGVCGNKISPSEYAKIVKHVQLLLEGRCEELIEQLTFLMLDHAQNLRFEAAAMIRDQLSSIRNVARSRRLLIPKPVDLDVFAFFKEEQTAMAEILFVRAGIIYGNTIITMEIPDGCPMEEISERMLNHYYSSGMPAPNQIIVSHEPHDPETLTRWFKTHLHRRVPIVKPLRGIKSKLLETAYSNLTHRIQISVEDERFSDEELTILQNELFLERKPVIIEAIDASESHGKHAVGSLVRFVNGTADKKRYRHFKMKDSNIRDDTHRIRDIVLRRMKRGSEPGWELPDLLIIDGGFGQLKAAYSALCQTNHEDLPIISVAKQRLKRSMEGIFFPDGKEINLSAESAAIKLIDRVRDEAHRFAINYHRKLRDKASMATTKRKKHKRLP